MADTLFLLLLLLMMIVIIYYIKTNIKNNVDSLYVSKKGLQTNLNNDISQNQK